MRKLVILMGIFLLLTVGCEGDICGHSFWWDCDPPKANRSPKVCDLTGSWSGNIGEVADGTFQVSQYGTDLLIAADSGYHAEGSNEGGKIELRNFSGKEIDGFVSKENEITLFGPDGHSGTLVRLQ
jgi:hypothetical protein